MSLNNKKLEKLDAAIRAQFAAKHNLTDEELIVLAKEQCAAHLTDKVIKKAIVVAHRHLINLVI